MPNGTLSYDEMVSIINSGQSVLLDGNIISSLEALPLPEKLSKTPQETAAIKDDLAAQLAALQARLDALEAQPVPAQSPVSEIDPTDSLPEAQINPTDGYPANHRALIAFAKAQGYDGRGPNPGRTTLVTWLNEHKQQ